MFLMMSSVFIHISGSVMWRQIISARQCVCVCVCVFKAHCCWGMQSLTPWPPTQIYPKKRLWVCMCVLILGKHADGCWTWVLYDRIDLPCRLTFDLLATLKKDAKHQQVDSGQFSHTITVWLLCDLWPLCSTWQWLQELGETGLRGSVYLIKPTAGK